jgi:thymidylate synthase
MIGHPITIVCDDFQNSWLEAAKHLIVSNWEVRNLIVQIGNPSILNVEFHEKMKAFAKEQKLLGPKHVAYTIFPHRLYERSRNAKRLFASYNRTNGLFDRLQHLKPSWGTYFRRMTNYEGTDGKVNQLENIITAIRNRRILSKAAYTIIIPHPGGETVRPLGAPCLNYIAVQAEPGQEGHPLTLGLLAVYRNHDFLERAYGNYWGLSNLLMFLAREVHGSPGPITCVSSHAYVPSKKRAFKELIEGF